MDETTRRIIEQITVRYSRLTKINSGHEVTTFYDCARLTANDLARLAAEATGHLGPDTADIVVGIAYSGVFFATAVAGGRQMALVQKDGDIFGADVKGQRVLVVDDVVCGGNNLTRAADVIERTGGKIIGYAAIVDRLSPSGEFRGLPVWSALQDPM